VGVIPQSKGTAKDGSAETKKFFLRTKNGGNVEIPPFFLFTGKIRDKKIIFFSNPESGCDPDEKGHFSID